MIPSHNEHAIRRGVCPGLSGKQASARSTRLRMVSLPNHFPFPVLVISAAGCLYLLSIGWFETVLWWNIHAKQMYTVAYNLERVESTSGSRGLYVQEHQTDA